MQTTHKLSRRTLSTAPLLAILLAALTSACTPSVKLDDVNASRIQDQNSVSQVDVTGKNGSDPLKDPNSPLAKRSVYFDFDSYTVKSTYQGLVENHAKYLNANKAQKILIQGNTDERGTTEYNLALGQKRAEAVRQSLSLLGVQNSQMEAVSLGKEKPKAEGHDESAWSQNRRADIVY